MQASSSAYTAPLSVEAAPVQRHGAASASLMLTALGVVYGDIGTSPLYALKESFNPAHGVVLNQTSIWGILSLLVWALTLVVTLKYIVLILRADNAGEGGILALQALARRALGVSSSAGSAQKAASRRGRILVACVGGTGLLGATMFYGDALITPAISVMSAIEGLEIATPAFKTYVLPITAVIIVGLFSVQRFGTAKVGSFFGPVMVVWFSLLGGLGIYHITAQPQILYALNPLHAALFITANPFMAFVVLGSVFLAVTGAEALYADMGHFGVSAVRRAWLWIAMPALVLNYLGQGALLLADPSALENPFFHMLPAWGVVPMVVLSAAATVIASQATISGAYSLTVQAIALGYLPRMKIVQTSQDAMGQIYIPGINWAMLAGVLVLVFSFGSSSNLSAAYGIAISITMLCTTLLFGVVAWRLWKWPVAVVAPMIGVMLLIDNVFVVSNAAKILQGGWMPIAVAIVLMLVMGTWARALRIRARSLQASGIELKDFVRSLLAHPPHRVEGTAVFLTSDTTLVPHALLHNLKHNQVLHANVVVLNLVASDHSRVDASKRLEVTELGAKFWLVRAHTGFSERTDVREIMKLLAYQKGIGVQDMSTTYFLSRSSPPKRRIKGFWPGQRTLFGLLQRHAGRAADFYQLPDNRTVEFGRSSG
jgi:KUP system potassium uptake protein